MSTLSKTMTTTEVAERFNELAQQEKWFEIQDELFADNVRSGQRRRPNRGSANGESSCRSVLARLLRGG